MNKLRSWRKEADRIARENKALHDRGEFMSDEFIITPLVPMPCRECAFNVDNDCIKDMCWNHDQFMRR